MTCNTEALNLDPGNIPAGKYRELIKKLNVNNKIEHHIDRYKKELTYKIDFLKNSHSDESPSYKILSIDGGGIRGILPALWLSEIEYRTHRPISHLFNMIAGTSTGGGIATGLSAPKFKPISETTDEHTEDHIEYEYSNLVPIFSASELFNIYKNESNKFISKSAPWLNVFSNARKTMVEKYFGKTRLSHSLTELVIPATNDNCSHLFTRNDACKNSMNNEVNNTFVDILMATTATPTFYPPHKISDKTFIDGGIYFNNPASAAYDEAIRYNVPKEKISVISLGTGCYLPDPSNPDQYSNLLFWTQN
ncbi:acyl transferase/acyl hydrolase/lysophospholipase [Gigaspora rosea]|uniref:Acyl transferase/acyl hydrolase/lysophospholipase n=1 Tax=Gigaspora rosea TaxID=44941 RepID=A0A397W0M5_9GLOM|nr:acyl transferase/acyl hydrolase/lysophospholipase [Gigaspora rosea]